MKTAITSIRKRKSIVPVDVKQTQLVHVQLSHGATEIKFKLCKNTPACVTEPGVWSLECHGNTEALNVDVTLRLNRFTDEYVDWFFYECKMGNFDHGSLYFKMFPNVKELSESVGMLHHITSHLPDPRTIVVVADGTTPRTGWLCAHMFPTAHVISVDPLMKKCYVDHSPLKNLEAHDCKIEEFITNSMRFEAPLCVVAPHNHVPLTDFVFALHAKIDSQEKDLLVVAMPCCTPQTLSQEEQTKLKLESLPEIVDFGIHSPKNHIFFWKTIVKQ